jgi:hypothetical protein
MSLILENINPEVAMPFLDDISIKGPYTDYDGEEALLRRESNGTGTQKYKGKQ